MSQIGVEVSYWLAKKLPVVWSCKSFVFSKSVTDHGQRTKKKLLESFKESRPKCSVIERLQSFGKCWRFQFWEIINKTDLQNQQRYDAKALAIEQEDISPNRPSKSQSILKLGESNYKYLF